MDNRFWKFLIPSVIGVLIFIVPIPYEDAFSIIVGIAAGALEGAMAHVIPYLNTAILGLSALVALLTVAVKPKFIMRNSYLKKLFDVSPFWLLSRLLGAVFVVMVLFEIGPEFIWHASTGGLMLHELLQMLLVWFVFAGFFLPLLTDFGAVEYVGTFLRPIFRPLFTVPGRSAVDATASFIGSSPVGIIITNRQYVGGFYTRREAAVIATCFSIVSLPFNLVVAGFLDLMGVFPQWYLTVFITTVICAIIMPRIYPLSRKLNTYHPDAPETISEEIPKGTSLGRWSLESAMKRSAEANVVNVPREGLKIVFNIWFGLLPLVMAWGTLSLIIAEFTPFFTWIATPFAFYLQLFGVPEAVAASPAAVAGFADMFLPAILVTGLPEITRFIIGVLSITQLIYMTEVGVVILQSELDLNFGDLLIIFLERTIISIPVIVLLAMILL